MAEVAELPPSTSTIEEAGTARKRIKLEIPEARIQGKLEHALSELKREAVLPGFRKGRAPLRLLEKRFGLDVRGTVKNELVAEAYEKAVEEHKIDAIGEPEIDLRSIELPTSGPLNVTLEVEVTPEFQLPKLEGLEIKKPKLEANEERLNLALDNLRNHFGTWKKSESAAVEGNSVLADVKLQGEDNQILAEQNGASLLIKSGSVLGVTFDDLVAKLTGATVGSVVTLEGTLPADHNDEALRSEKVTATLSIREIYFHHRPELDAAFMELLGFENLETLKKDLQERLVTQLETEAKSAMSQQVYRYLVGNITLELPAKLSARQADNVVRRRAVDLLRRGLPEGEVLAKIQELRISSTQQAALDLKLFFILTKLAEQFGVKVDDSEVNGRIASIGYQYGRRPEKVRQEMAANGQIEQVYLQIRDDKVVDEILKLATIVEVDEKVLAEELKALPPMGINVQGISTAS